MGEEALDWKLLLREGLHHLVDGLKQLRDRIFLLREFLTGRRFLEALSIGARLAILEVANEKLF